MTKIDISQIGETNADEDRAIQEILQALPHHFGKTETFSLHETSELVLTFVISAATSGATFDMIKHAIQQFIHHPLLNLGKKPVVIVETKEQQLAISQQTIILTNRTEKRIECESADQAFHLLQDSTVKNTDS